jgi:uncharacterized coiled-coil DUF342 family protein
MQTIADLRANADKRLKDVTALRSEYQKQWKELIDSLSSRKGIAVQLVQAQNEIAGIREKRNHENEKVMNGFLPDDMKVSIDFRAGRDTEEFEDILYRIFSYKSKQL